LYAGKICSVYRARHRTNRRNEESTARNKLIIEDMFEDGKDDCLKEESTARNDKPIVEDVFKYDKDDIILAENEVPR
jgi:hypothetical protein